MAILNVPITQATCTRAELEAARLLNGLVAARIYYISNEQIYELATGPNTTIQYLPTTSTPGDIGAEPAITPKGTAFNQDFGVGSGDVCEGDDARLHDDRDPTLHAASHAQGGLDELTPAAIGAATAADVAGKVAKAGDTMTGDLNLTSAKVLITDGGVRSVHIPFDYNDPSDGVGGFGLEDAGDASTTGGMVLMTNPATGTEEVTVGSVDGSTGLRLRAPHVVVDAQSVAVALEAAEAGSSIIVTGFTQTGEAILGAVQPPGTAYEETQIDTRNLSLGTGDGTGAWVDVVVLDALTQECQDNLTQIIYQMYMANSSTAETKVEVGYRIDGVDPAEWRLHDLGTSSSGVSISDVFQPPSNLLLGQVLTLTARRVGTHADSTASIQGSAIDASSFKVRVIQAAVSTGEANRGFALASPNVYHSMDGFNLQFRGMADTGDIEWSTPSADTLGADLTTQAGVTPGTYTYPTIQVDAKGRVVTISNQIGGGLDHGALGGLGDDDHTQYHNDARGDLRYAAIAHAFTHNVGGSDALAPSAIGAEPEITPKGTAFNKDFGTGADTVCAGDDSRLALAESALQNVVEDLTPVAGGNFTVGGVSNHRIIFTDDVDKEHGSVGYVDESGTGGPRGVYLAYAPSGVYDQSDGAVVIDSGKVQVNGAVASVRSLEHAGTAKQVYANADGALYGVDPPDPGWTATDTSTDNMPELGTLGLWVEIPNLEVYPVADILIGERLDFVGVVGLVDSSVRSGSVAINVGINGASPIGDGQIFPIAGGFYGQLTTSLTLTSHGGLTTADRLSLWVMRYTEDHGQFSPAVNSSPGDHEMILSVPGAGSGGGGDPTDITINQSGASNIVVESNTGTNGTILPATATEAGGMSAADKVTLDGLSSFAQVWTTPRVSVNGNGNSWSFTPDGQVYDYHPDPLYNSISFAIVPPANQDTLDSTSIVDFHAPDAGSWTFTVATGDLLNGFVPPVINAGDPPVSIVVRYLPGEITAQLSYLDSTDPAALGDGGSLPARVAVALSGTDTWAPDLADGEAYTLNIAAGATIALAPVSSGDDAAHEYTCSFEINFAGAGTINIDAGVIQMSTFGAITDGDGETTGILRSRADGTIELYRASEVTS